jgi:crotonobetainyl-CoA:carnitine CoA-transferase CaiB-like acyl-CoA transferase
VQALEGVRVVELATVFAGPGTAKYLGDFGADVIKVEAPTGDGVRGMGWRDPRDDQTFIWKILGRNKRTVVLDLKTDAGLDAMQRLVDEADVLIENLRPGILERLGLDPESLLARNPGLVVLRVTGFGQTGPYASRPGFATLAEAMGGFAAINGEPDGPPLLPPIALTDELAALVGAFATLAALRHRDRTGEGQIVDVNLLESMLQVMGPLPSVWAELGELQPRLGSGIPYSVPRGTYQCADGVWVAVSTSAESVAHRLLGLLGAPRRARSPGRRLDRRSPVGRGARGVRGRRGRDRTRVHDGGSAGGRARARAGSHRRGRRRPHAGARRAALTDPGSGAPRRTRARRRHRRGVGAAH